MPSKTPKLPPDSEGLRTALATFNKQTDRGAALVASAWVDDALDGYFRALFRPNSRLRDELLKPDQPLGSFGARIKLIYMLGLVEEATWKDLEQIKFIRNKFAHVRESVRFTHQAIKDRCKQLHAVKAINLGRGWVGSLRSAREMFLLTCYFLTEHLIALAESAEPNFYTADVYGAAIRTYVKSVTVSQVLEYLQAQPKPPGDA